MQITVIECIWTLFRVSIGTNNTGGNGNLDDAFAVRVFLGRAEYDTTARSSFADWKREIWRCRKPGTQPLADRSKMKMFQDGFLSSGRTKDRAQAVHDDGAVHTDGVGTDCPGGKAGFAGGFESIP